MFRACLSHDQYAQCFGMLIMHSRLKPNQQFADTCMHGSIRGRMLGEELNQMLFLKSILSPDALGSSV